MSSKVLPIIITFLFISGCSFFTATSPWQPLPDELPLYQNFIAKGEIQFSAGNFRYIGKVILQVGVDKIRIDFLQPGIFSLHPAPDFSAVLVHDQWYLHFPKNPTNDKPHLQEDPTIHYRPLLYTFPVLLGWTFSPIAQRETIQCKMAGERITQWQFPEWQLRLEITYKGDDFSQWELYHPDFHANILWNQIKKTEIPEKNFYPSFVH